MPKLIDLTGQRFGRWTVLNKAPSKNRMVYWNCQCDCGTIKTVKGASLRNGESQSCGCLHKEIAKQTCSNIGKQNKKDLIGQIFGHLTVLKDSNQRYVNGSVIWECQCDCGNKIKVPSKFLLNGDVFSCGCQQKASKGEYKIMQILIANKIQFETQKTFNTCRFQDTQYVAKFDFYLPDYNTLIEYDGEQHFKENIQSSGWNSKKNYDIIKYRDNYKNQWCKENNILLIRIPYTHYNEICIEDLLPNTSTFLFGGY